MLGKIILLPFWVIKKGVGTVFGILRLVLGRRLGTIVVLVAAFFLGKKYLEKKAGNVKES